MGFEWVGGGWAEWGGMGGEWVGGVNGGVSWWIAGWMGGSVRE